MNPIDGIVERTGVGIDPDWSTALYASPPSHDFLTWLLAAELMRREKGAPAPLKVAFLLENGQLGLKDYGNVSIAINPGGRTDCSMAYSSQMLAHVLRPAIGMIGGVNLPDLHAPIKYEKIERYCEYTYFLHSIVDAARAGYEVPLFHPPEWAQKEVDLFLDGSKPLVITLREAPHQPERNSNQGEWLKFAGWAYREGFEVLFVRDTAFANCQFGGWPTWHRASTDAHVRLALYQQALCNFIVGNGPMGWCTYSKAPYIAFKQIIDALPGWDHGQVEGWKRMDHLDFGDQIPWAHKKQRFSWKDDTFENIREEFEQFWKLS